MANKNYRKAADLDANLTEAWYGLGVTDRSLAEELLNRAVRKGENTPANEERVHRLLDDALKALTWALELDPGSASTHLVMAESLSDSGKFTEAIAEYQTALTLDSRMQAASLGLASQYWKQRQFDQAVRFCSKFCEKRPKIRRPKG